MNQLDRKQIILNQQNSLNRTSVYVPITSGQIVKHLADNNLQLTDTVLTKPRNKNREGYQKHMLRFQSRELNLRGIADSVPEIVIVNSYDGSTSLQIKIGIFRLVCANGLIIGNTYAQQSLRHAGNVLDNLNLAIDNTIKQLPIAASQIAQFSAIQTTSEIGREFASRVSKLIFPEQSDDSKVQFSLDDMLRTRRGQDNTLTLWHTLNVLQEVAIRGGLTYFKTDDNKTIKNTTRAVKSIQRQVELNEAIWVIASELAGET